MQWPSLILSALLGYLIGPIPTGALMGRLLGVDVSRSGSGHTGATNVARTTGRLWPALVTALLDVFWGLLPVLLAKRWFAGPWPPVAAGTLAVAGHNWSAYLRFRGGVGIATFGGTILGLVSGTTALQGAALLIVLWIAIYRVLRHAPRTTVLVALSVAPLLWSLGAPANATWAAAFGVMPVIIQSLRDWNRVYEPKGAA